MSSTEREAMLTRVRASLRDVKPTPYNSMRVAPRVAREAESEIEMFLAEVAKLNGITRRISDAHALETALGDLVRTENIRVATVWKTAELSSVRNLLAQFDVTLVDPEASPRELAQCDLGVTSADAILPETGTLVLRTTPAHAPFVSLLPRVHLAFVRVEMLRADLSVVFEEIKHDRHGVLVTGPSRTTDIEKVLTIGVHGPKALHVWVWS